MLRIASRTVSPSKFCIKLSIAFVALFFSAAVVLGLLEQVVMLAHLSKFGAAALLSFMLLGVVDGVVVLRQPQVSVVRSNAKSISVDKWIDVCLAIDHSFAAPRSLTLFDGLSAHSDYKNLPLSVRLLPAKRSSVYYRMKVTVRGPYIFGQCHVKILSPLRLWDCQYRAAEPSEIKVFPDFSAISALTLLSMDNHESHIGIKRKPRRGEGMEFLQLRGHRSGDSLRQIDWKAVSRRNELISKEYQDERDQHIVLLIDASRRMRSQDDTLNHFDHSLNATLLVSYLALRQGDSVSVMSFGRSHRWIASQKGARAMKTILHGMYDLHAERCAPDYVTAAEKLSNLQQKRSLVILVTNSRDEDLDELTMAANLIKRRHLLLLANIREAVVDEQHSKPVETLDDALGYVGLHRYLRQRQKTKQTLRNKGIFAIECDAKNLAVSVANSYLEIKRSGVL